MCVRLNSIYLCVSRLDFLHSYMLTKFQLLISNYAVMKRKTQNIDFRKQVIQSTFMKLT
jgi:hypothetical protein